MPGVARVDHRTKCVSLVTISLSQNFESSNNPRSKQRNIPSERTTKKIPPRNGPQRKYHLGTDPKENTTSERTPKKIPPHRRYQGTDLELTKNKTPPLHSNRRLATRTQSQKVSRFRFYIYRFWEFTSRKYRPKVYLALVVERGNKYNFLVAKTRK
jgi:hypothetical protein